MKREGLVILAGNEKMCMAFKVAKSSPAAQQGGVQ